MNNLSLSLAIQQISTATPTDTGFTQQLLQLAEHVFNYGQQCLEMQRELPKSLDLYVTVTLNKQGQPTCLKRIYALGAEYPRPGGK